MPKSSWHWAFGSSVAKYLRLGFAAAALATAALAQAPEGEELVPFLLQAPVVDGNLEEWTGEPQVRLIRPEQVWNSAERGGWGGEDDLSGEFYLAYDRNHLYVAGRVRDNSRVGLEEDQQWHLGDAVELFLDLDLDDDRDAEGQRIARPFDQDDVQIFLMPLNVDRPSWGVMDYGADPPRPGSLSLTGFRVVGLSDPSGYSFEAAIPLHHFNALGSDTRRIGFNLALDDHDDDTERYQYMTWTGANPVTPVQDTRNMATLVFAGPPPLSGGSQASPSISVSLLNDSPYLVVPLLAVGLLFLLMRLWAPLRRRFPRLRPALLTLGAAVFVTGLFIPSVWMGWRQARGEAQLQQVSATLQEQLPMMERGALASYRGAQRDEALVDLLAGKAIARQQYWDYRPLAELVEEGLGEEPWTFPAQFFTVRPYWIPLPPRQPEQFDFPETEPLRGKFLHVVVARPYPALLTVDGSPAALHIDMLSAVDGELTSEDYLLDRPWEDAGELGRSGWEVTYTPVSLPGPVSRVSVAATNGDALVLVGLTLEPEAARGEEARPLFLGQASLGGVETDLRGPYPLSAGLELESGSQRRLGIPEDRAQPFQKLWVFYRAEYPGTLSPTVVGTPVARVTVSFREERVPQQQVDLHHQLSMLFELERHNSVARPEDPVELAFVWEDAERERHVNLVYEVDLPEGATVESLQFENLAQYRIGFRSVVFGSPRPATPQIVGGSPLVPTETGEVELQAAILDQLDGVEFAVYRDGRLTESTMADAQRVDRLAISRDVQQQLSADQPYSRHVALDRGNVFETYTLLSGDGWQGAALGMFMADVGHQGAQRNSSLLGVILLLLSSPVLLVLFSDLLALLGNLRLRLIAVLSAATLVPLALLSVILVGVLERGHEADMERNMRQGLVTARNQLEEQARLLVESADSWLASLIQEPLFGDGLDEILESMGALMESQLPLDWHGGFQRLDFVPDPETPGVPLTVSAGNVHLSRTETPFHAEPAIYLAWGTPILAVSRERAEEEGRWALAVGRPLDAGLLATLAGDRSVLLMDTRGYPLDAAASQVAGPTAQELDRNALSPRVMEERARILDEVLEQGQPVVRHQPAPGGDWLVGYDVLRDAQDTPRALLALVQPHQRAMLELPMSQLPVRAFFMLAGGLVVLLSVFLSFLVTSRISRPIERLEEGARALSRGSLDVQVVAEERGEIGRLTRTFNEMAQELRGRMRDLSLLNRGIQDLSSSTLELSAAIATTRDFCAANSPAHAVRVGLLDREHHRMELHGDGVQTLDLNGADVRTVLSGRGPFSMRLDPDSALASTVEPIATAVVLPMVLGGRAVGAILLLFREREPLAVNLELLTTVASQAATAVVNAQLYRHAVRDPYTGAYMPEYFHPRVVQEVARAQERGESLVLLGLRPKDPARVKSLDREDFTGLLERISGHLQEHMPEGGFLCHRGEGRFEVLSPGVTPGQARALLDTWIGELAPIEAMAGAMARYPDDAVSAEFLFAALEENLASGRGYSPDEDTEPREEGVLPSSPGMREVYLTLRKVAPTDLTILLEGETGTGKEILTDNIHRWSRRSAGPLVKVHCAALAENLVQSELFGHEKGSFTGATARKIGRFELAQGGTIFLDEVGEISLDVQVQLLRVLQEREIDRVGGTAPVPVDVRVIAATNRDLVEMVQEGGFREDLYYRLQGMVIRVPPLRERKQEIPTLVEHFRKEAEAAGHTRVEGFSTDAMDELFRRSWPGNIRELRNACFRAMVLASGPQVELTDLLGILTPAPETAAAKTVAPPTPPPVAANRETPAEPAETVVTIPRPSLSGRLRELHELVARSGSISTEDYAASSGVSPRTGLRDLQQLVARGYLERVGKRRGARYRIPIPDARQR